MNLDGILAEENTLAGTGFCHWRNMREILTIKAIALGGFSNSIEALGKNIS